MSTMNEDSNLEVTEIVVLKKYEGDEDTGALLETVLIENGVIKEVIKGV